MRSPVTAESVALILLSCWITTAAWSLPASGASTHRFLPKTDTRGFIDVWRLRDDVAIVETQYADDNTDVCEHEGDGDAPSAREQQRLDRTETTCKADVQRRHAAYQAVFAAFNRAWLPTIRSAIAKGDAVAEVILRQCGTTAALDRSGIESTCDEEPKKSIAMGRLHAIGFVPALGIDLPNWQQSPDHRKTQLASQQRVLDAIRHGALGFDTMEVSTDGNVAGDADSLQSYRNYAVIEAALQDAPEAFTVTPGSFSAGWKTSVFAVLRLNRKPLTPGYLAWGRRLYCGGNPSVYTGPHYWRSAPTRVYVPRGGSQEEIAVSGADEQQFRRELAETLAATAASIKDYLKQDPRWGVFLLHRVGRHEWVPERTRSTTQRLDPAWVGKWTLVKQTADWEKPMQPAIGHASIRRDGDLMRMSVSAPDARESFPDVQGCMLRYSGGSTYLPDENANDDVNTALGYIDAAESRAALASLDRRKRYRQVLMECPGAESLDSDRMRFLLLAGDSLVEIGYAGTPSQRQLAVRHYRRAR